MTSETTKHPLRFVICDGPNDEPALCCPVCGFDCVHPVEVVVEQGQTKTVVTRETTQVEATNRGTMKRGSLIILRFVCEDGHEFAYQFEFHKGTTSCELNAGLDSGLGGLWRD